MSDVLDLINRPTLETQGSGEFTDSTFATRGEVLPTQALDTVLNQNLSSKFVATALGIDDFRKSFKRDLGIDLDRAVYEDQIETLKAEGKQFRDLGYIPEADQDSIRAYVNKNKGKIKGLDTFLSIEERAKNFALDAKAKAAQAYKDAPDGLTTGIASFAGGFAGSIVDPINIASMSMGAGAGLSLMKTVALEAGINAGVEVAIQPFVANWQKEIGSEYTFGDAALNVGFAALFGGLFGGFSKVLSGSPDAKIKVADIPDAPTPPSAKQVIQVRDFTGGDTLGAIDAGVQRAIYKGITVAFDAKTAPAPKTKLPVELKTGRAESVQDFKAEIEKITSVKDQRLAELEAETRAAIDALDKPLPVSEQVLDKAIAKKLPRKQKKKVKKALEPESLVISPKARAKAVAELQEEYEVRAREIVNEYNQEVNFYVKEQTKIDARNAETFQGYKELDFQGMSKAYVLQRAKTQSERLAPMTPEKKAAFDIEFRRAHSDDYNIHRDSPELDDGKHQAALLEVDAAIREGRPVDPAKINISDEEFLAINTETDSSTPPLKAERLKAIKEMQDLIGAKVDNININGGQLGDERSGSRESRTGQLSEEISRVSTSDKESREILSSELKNTPRGRKFSTRIRELARKYQESRGLDYTQQSEYVKVDIPRAERIAQAFEEMKHDPQNPRVKKAYNDLIKETYDQYQIIKKSGLKIEVIKQGQPDPYKGISQNMIDDVLDNNHLWLYPTDSGFGTLGKIEDNPLLGLSGETIDGFPLTHNDLFRVVHDYFGHVKEGNGFRALGEENAWQSHVGMYSRDAALAMTSETRGQNSWLNFGPYGAKNRTAKVEDTVFADQKIGLLPDWVLNEGRSPVDVIPLKTKVRAQEKLPSYERSVDDEFFGDAPPQVNTSSDKLTLASERAKEILSPANVAARRAELEADLIELGDNSILIDGESYKASDYLKELKKADNEITALDVCRLK